MSSFSTRVDNCIIILLKIAFSRKSLYYITLYIYYLIMLYLCLSSSHSVNAEGPHNVAFMAIFFVCKISIVNICVYMYIYNCCSLYYRGSGRGIWWRRIRIRVIHSVKGLQLQRKQKCSRPICCSHIWSLYQGHQPSFPHHGIINYTLQQKLILKLFLQRIVIFRLSISLS